MLKNRGTILAIAFLALTFVFWLTSVVTPGWFVSSTRGYGRKHKLSMFYVVECINDHCDSHSFNDLYKKSLGIHITHQVESLLSLIMCLISGAMLIIPNIRTETRYFVAVITIPVAATLQSVLILTFALENFRIASKFAYTVYFPYSVLLSVLGTLLSIAAWVMCVVVYKKLRNQESQNQRHRVEQNYTELLPSAELPV